MTEVIPYNQSNVKTMSSREIAELTGKRHDNVMRDIETMISDLQFEESDFKGTYKNKRGKIYPCYHLPKRETLILVSGYDTNLRAKIIDRWAELEVEKRQQPKPKKPVSPLSYIKVHQYIKQTLSQTGLEENQLLLATNKCVASLTGFDLLASADVTHLPSPHNDEYLTPTQIGERLDPQISPREVNRRLFNCGLQIQKHDGKGYVPTPEGKEYGGRMMDVSKAHTSGSTQQLKWNSSIVDVLQNGMNERNLNL